MIVVSAAAAICTHVIVKPVGRELHLGIDWASVPVLWRELVHVGTD